MLESCTEERGYIWVFFCGESARIKSKLSEFSFDLVAEFGMNSYRFECGAGGRVGDRGEAVCCGGTHERQGRKERGRMNRYFYFAVASQVI
jgi:hypothetical protein